MGRERKQDCWWLWAIHGMLVVCDIIQRKWVKDAAGFPDAGFPQALKQPMQHEAGVNLRHITIGPKAQCHLETCLAGIKERLGTPEGYINWAILQWQGNCCTLFLETD